MGILATLCPESVAKYTYNIIDKNTNTGLLYVLLDCVTNPAKLPSFSLYEFIIIWKYVLYGYKLDVGYTTPVCI